ncbi:hypothetical protein SNEBB_008716 [Seison nebaliae]|nr:hypothetical protein SNEBB_008716 [Seison nebaliae]
MGCTSSKATDHHEEKLENKKKRSGKKNSCKTSVKLSDEENQKIINENVKNLKNISTENGDSGIDMNRNSPTKFFISSLEREYVRKHKTEILALIGERVSNRLVEAISLAQNVPPQSEIPPENESIKLVGKMTMRLISVAEDHGYVETIVNDCIHSIVQNDDDLPIELDELEKNLRAKYCGGEELTKEQTESAGLIISDVIPTIKDITKSFRDGGGSFELSSLKPSVSLSDKEEIDSLKKQEENYIQEMNEKINESLKNQSTISAMSMREAKELARMAFYSENGGNESDENVIESDEWKKGEISFIKNTKDIEDENTTSTRSTTPKNVEIVERTEIDFVHVNRENSEMEMVKGSLEKFNCVSAGDGEILENANIINELMEDDDSDKDNLVTVEKMDEIIITENGYDGMENDIILKEDTNRIINVGDETECMNSNLVVDSQTISSYIHHDIIEKAHEKWNKEMVDGNEIELKQFAKDYITNILTSLSEHRLTSLQPIDLSKKRRYSFRRSPNAIQSSDEDDYLNSSITTTTIDNEQNVEMEESDLMEDDSLVDSDQQQQQQQETPEFQSLNSRENKTEIVRPRITSIMPSVMYDFNTPPSRQYGSLSESSSQFSYASTVIYNSMEMSDHLNEGQKMKSFQQNLTNQQSNFHNSKSSMEDMVNSLIDVKLNDAEMEESAQERTLIENNN